MSLDINVLTQYSGQGKCKEVMCNNDTADRYGEELRSCARRINWKVTVRLGNYQIKIERRSESISYIVPEMLSHPIRWMKQ